MDGGCLRSRFIGPIVRMYIGEDGEQRTETISIERQVADLSPEWKPVDMIDEARLNSDDGNYIIVPVPYDAGERISYEYVRKFDVKRVRTEIERLKNSLGESDYKIMKCYEAYMLGGTLPYDIDTLHKERQQERDRINELESIISAYL